MNGGKRLSALWLVLLGGVVLMLPLAAGYGTVSIPWPDVIGVLKHEWFGLGKPGDPVYQTILLDVRIPRVLLVAVVGGALALCGGVLQATFKNPLADPGLLGISAGGALGAVMAIFLGWANQAIFALPLCAFLGAMGAVMVVFFIASIGGPASTASLLLTGVAVGSFSIACLSFLLLKSDQPQVQQILFWLAGGAEARTWEHLWMGLPPISAGATLLIAGHRSLDALLLGDEHALSVGVDVKKARYLFLTLSALVAGAAVSVCGSIAFVGLVVPHMLRLFTGPAARRLLPACLAGGALFLLICDLIARLISSKFEIPMGIISSLMGVPFFLWLLVRAKRGGK